MDKKTKMLLEERVFREIREAENLSETIKRNRLNHVLGFLSCYLWAGGDKNFYNDMYDLVILKLYGVKL